MEGPGAGTPTACCQIQLMREKYGGAERTRKDDVALEGTSDFRKVEFPVRIQWCQLSHCVNPDTRVQDFAILL